jgi:glycosyltransferase involved in cell wall biosynthesis
MAEDVQPVRVVVVSSVHRWNDTRILVRQAASLAAAGYAVTLVAIGTEASTFDSHGVKVITLPRRPRTARWRTWLEIVRLVIRERAAVVHAHDPELFPVVTLLKAAGCKTICDVHENVSQQVLHKEWIPGVVRRPLSYALGAFMRALPTVADAVILAEDSYQRDIRVADNVAIVRNFPVLPPGSKRDYRADVLKLIYVGDVRAVRGIGEYIRITAALVEKGVPVELRIVGSFADKREEAFFTAEVERLGIRCHVAFLGRRPPEEIPSLVDDADVGLALLHPIGNYRESYPTKMFEYMAAGLPVVASRFELWERVLVPNQCGRVVDPLQIDEAVDVILEYWRSPTLREQHGRNGRAAATARYNWGAEVPTLLRIYSRLTGRRAQSAGLTHLRERPSEK